MAILEFSSSNGFSSFTLNFECRRIRIRDIGDENNNHFIYLVELPWYIDGSWNDTSCDERGYDSNIAYEEWDIDNRVSEWIDSFDCITTFQG